MVSTDYLPSSDAGLLAWTGTFAAKINAGAGGNYGLTVQQTSAYAALQSDFAFRMAQVADPSTDSTVNRGGKNDTGKSLVKMTRQLVNAIQGNPATTDDDRSALGLTVRKRTNTRTPTPKQPPKISIEHAFGTEVKIRLADAASPESRAKPVGVAGAAILTSLGDAPPLLSDIASWTFQGTVSRMLSTIEFPGARSGTTAWITAMWFNPRSENGPPAQPISVQIPGQLPGQEEQSLPFPDATGSAGRMSNAA